MAKQKNPPNLLDLKPVRLFEHRIEEELVTVLVPRYRSRWMAWLQRRLSRPHFKLHLDSVGSKVWLLCDGERTVEEIGKLVRECFGDDVEPLWERLGMFFRQMAKGRLVELKEG